MTANFWSETAAAGRELQRMLDAAKRAAERGELTSDAAGALQRAVSAFAQLVPSQPAAEVPLARGTPTWNEAIASQYLQLRNSGVDL